MKEQMKNKDRKRFERLSSIYSILLTLIMVLPIPLVSFMGYFGVAIWMLTAGCSLYFDIMVERIKRSLIFRHIVK